MPIQPTMTLTDDEIEVVLLGSSQGLLAGRRTDDMEGDQERSVGSTDIEDTGTDTDDS